MPAKSFDVKRDAKPTLAAIGFPTDMACKAFVNVRVGTGHEGEYQIILHMDDARAFAAALNSAINHAEPRAVATAADLGIAA